jgi:hypothetical protein
MDLLSQKMGSVGDIYFVRQVHRVVYTDAI